MANKKYSAEQIAAMSDDEVMNALAEAKGESSSSAETTIDEPAPTTSTAYDELIAESEIPNTGAALGKDTEIGAPDDGWLTTARDAAEYVPGMAGDFLRDTAADPKGAAKDLAANALETGAGLASSIPFAASPALVPVAYTAGSRGGRLLSEKFGLRDKESLGDFTKGAVTEGVINTVAPVLGKTLGLGEATRKAAAKEVGGITQNLGTNIASGEMKALRRTTAETENFIRDSKIFDGGNSYNIKTGKIESIGGATKPATTSDVSKNIDEILNGAGGRPSLVKQRDQIVSDLDDAAMNFTLANPSRAISKTDWGKIDQHLTGAKDLAERYSRTPVETLTDAQKQIVTTLNDLQKGWEFGNLVGPTGKPIGPIKQLKLSEVNDQLSNVYAALRKLGAYDASMKNKQVLTGADKFGVEETMNALGQAAQGLRAERDKKIEEIVRKAGASTASLKGLTADTIKNVNNAVHNLLSIKTGIDVHSDAAGLVGARGLMVDQASPEGLTNFSEPGILKRIVSAAKSPFGFGPDTANLRMRRQALTGIQDSISRSRGITPAGPSIARAGEILQSPGAQAMADILGPQDKPQRTYDPGVGSAWDRIVGQVATHAAANGTAPTSAGKIPRTIQGVTQNMDRLMQVVPPEAAAELQSMIQSGVTPQKAAALGTFLKHFPIASRLFEDPASGLQSEFEGKLQSQDDLAAAAQEIEESDGTDGTKAIALKELWDTRSYKRKTAPTQSSAEAVTSIP